VKNEAMRLADSGATAVLVEENVPQPQLPTAFELTRHLAINEPSAAAALAQR
jgi:hypothetical protein